MSAETEPERGQRRQQRTLFDRVAGLYEETRPTYAGELIDFVVATAGLGPGAAVLDVGCGTGQLTGPLARRGYGVTAIDLGPSMIEVARRRPGAEDVCFHVGSFEDFEAPAGSFDLIVSAAAFHWIDPEVRFGQAARLLRPGGWLAVLGASEHYDAPFGPVLDEMWLTRANHEGAWVTRPGDADAFAASGLFGPTVKRSFEDRVTYTADAVIGVENTRATTLSWPDHVRRTFNAELRRRLRSHPEVPLTLESSVTMAPIRARPR